MVQLYGRSGDEFLVNTVTQDVQSAPLTVRLASGGFVLVWADFSEGGYFFTVRGVKAQIYDAAGARVGGEIVVNSSKADWWPDGVAALPNGGFIITYDTGEVTAQMFDAAGAKIGGEIFVTAPDPAVPADRQYNANSDVTVLASGEIVITWDKVVQFDVDVYAQVLTPAGAKSGSEFRVHAHTSQHSRYPPSPPSPPAVTSSSGTRLSNMGAGSSGRPSTLSAPRPGICSG
ncbi:MAG TPA: hypothetical protein VD846_02685 [Allosphingosinicella sp.]|nr:hypothetical protein [Allosphingosinicella sp.]